MNITTTRRRFIEIVPFAGAGLFAACSPSTDTASTSATKVIPPAASPTPAPTPAPMPAPAPTSAATGVAMVDEKDAQAIALGYVEDASRVDKVKFPSYVAGSNCKGCALYLGKADDLAGGCPLFPAKNVAATGWCRSWVKKA